MKTKKVIIAGAGIGGLSVGGALLRAGFETVVYEKTPRLEPVGAGIALWANALHALKRLGVDERLPVYDGAMQAALRTADGAVLTVQATEALQSRYGELSAVVHRAELHDVLLRFYGRGRLATGKAVTGYEIHDGKVAVTLSDGSTDEGDVLVAADGLHSAVRAQLHPGNDLRYSGYTAWRGVTDFDAKRIKPGETWGRGLRFGQSILSGNRSYWFATANRPAGEKSPDGEQAEIMRLFGAWHDPIPELIWATPAAAVLRHDIHDRPPLARWGQGPVTLLGDAAHPTTPNLGQGGCMAIEDAVVLRDALLAESSVEAALRNYEARRIPRTTQLVKQAWSIGRVGQIENPLGIALRNFAFRTIAPLVQDRQLDAVIGYRV